MTLTRYGAFQTDPIFSVASFPCADSAISYGAAHAVSAREVEARGNTTDHTDRDGRLGGGRSGVAGSICGVRPVSAVTGRRNFLKPLSPSESSVATRRWPSRQGGDMGIAAKQRPVGNSPRGRWAAGIDVRRHAVSGAECLRSPRAATSIAVPSRTSPHAAGRACAGAPSSHG